jgi:hypothetical protein
LDWHDEVRHQDVMLGTTREEFISAALHIFARSKMPDAKRLLPEHIQFAKLMAVAEYAQDERKAGLNAVAAAEFDVWNFPPRLKRKIDKADFDQFRKLVGSYAEQGISDRVEQARALKKLSLNATMQEFHKLFGDQEANKDWLELLKKNRPLFTGIILLVDRVDRNQPIFNEPPTSPRAAAPVAATTATTATNLPHMDEGADDSSSDSGYVSDSYTSSSSDGDEDSQDESDEEPIQRTDKGPISPRGADRTETRKAEQRRSSVDGPSRENYDDDDNDVDNRSDYKSENRSNYTPIRMGGSTASSPRTPSSNMNSSRSKYMDMLCVTKEVIDQPYEADAKAGDRQSPIGQVKSINKESGHSRKAVSPTSARTLAGTLTTSSDSDSDTDTDSKVD